MIVLGIDPGNVRLGYGIIHALRSTMTHVASGIIQIPRTTHAEELVTVEHELRALIQKQKPDCVGIEKLFLTKNKKTVMRVAHARGLILYIIASCGIPFYEFTPSAIKSSLTGDGTASKDGVAKIVKLTLGLSGSFLDDITDALAIAIVTAQHARYAPTRTFPQEHR